jgi:hypothetical protein
MSTGGAQPLGRRQCLALMTTESIGRIVYTDRALPAITPVTFVLDGDDVAFRVEARSRLAEAVEDTVVTFQVDGAGLANLVCWSVTVIGPARTVVSPAEAAHLSSLPFGPWPPLADALFVRLSTQHISGDRLAVATAMRSTA